MKESQGNPIRPLGLRQHYGLLGLVQPHREDLAPPSLGSDGLCEARWQAGGQAGGWAGGRQAGRRAGRRAGGQRHFFFRWFQAFVGPLRVGHFAASPDFRSMDPGRIRGARLFMYLYLYLCIYR